MAQRAFVVPTEVPRLVEHAAQLASQHGRTSAAQRRFLEDVFVACAVAEPGARAVLSCDDDGSSLRLEIRCGEEEPRVIDAPPAQPTPGIEEPCQDPQSWLFGFAQEAVRNLTQLRRELDDTNHGVVALYSELDSRHDAERQLQQELEERAQRLLTVDKRKDEFIAMLGHELRNPIATIEGAVQTLRELPGVGDAPEASPLLDVLYRQGRNVKRLLDDLLNVSRIKRGKVVLTRQPTDLAKLVRACAKDVASRVEVRQHRLHVEVPDEPVWLSADAARIEQVITNLLDNAIKYTPAGGDITLRLTSEGDEAIIVVQDTGVGIDTQRIRSAFEAFVQFDVSLDRSAGGMGLGLSVVKALVELHGGHVRAHSPGRNQGSTFEVRFPLLDESAQPQSVAPRASEAGQSMPSDSLVLLVEDNVDLRELTARRLSRRGFRVVEAGSVEEALSRAEAEPPDVLVTDIGLPGRDGFDLARSLDAHLGEGAACARVALSGYGPPKDASLRALFDAYMVKPLDIDALLDLVERRES